MAILRDSRFCLYNSVMLLCFLLFTLDVFKHLFNKRKLTEHGVCYTYLRPRREGRLRSSSVSHWVAPSMTSEQQMVRRSWFPVVFLLRCSVWTSVFFHQCLRPDTGATRKLLMVSTGTILPQTPPPPQPIICIASCMEASKA